MTRRDSCTSEGAYALAVRIARYWAERGVKVETTVKSVAQDGARAGIYGVRSTGIPVRGPAQ